MNLQRNLGQFLTNVTASLVSGSMGIMASVSYVTLIYASHCPEYLGLGISIALFSSVVLQSGVALLSSFPCTIADIGALPITIFALTAVEIHDQMVGSDPKTLFVTITTSIALTTVLTGLFFFVLGRLRIGELIRFIPYPVVVGFLAGMGCLLITGSLQVMTGMSLSWSQLPAFFTPQAAAQEVVGISMGVMLWGICRRVRHAFVFPACLMSFIALFYLGLWMTHTTLSDAQVQGWLLGSFSAEQFWGTNLVVQLRSADWKMVVSQLPRLSTIMPIAALALILSVGSLSLATEQDIQVNRELEAAGIANCLSGLCGGMMGYHIISDSLLAYRMRASHRLVGVFNALLCLGVLFWGANLLIYCPKTVLGGMLLFLGLDTLWEWLIEKRSQLPRADYMVVLIITMVITTVGFLEGVTVGLILAIVLFVINYSQINIIRSMLTGKTLRSHIRRSFPQEERLKKVSDRLLIVRLQGCLVLGNAEQLVRKIRQRIQLRQQQSPKAAYRIILLDFTFVSGIDSSAVLSFIQLEQLVREQHIRLAGTNFSPWVIQTLKQGGCFRTQHNGHRRLFTSFDEGLAWCEDQLLDQARATEPPEAPLPHLATQLRQMGLTTEQIPRFMAYLERLEVERGTVLFRQGEPADGLYFLEAGQVSVILEQSSQGNKRLRTFQSGTIIGEMGIYTQTPRSATVIIDIPSRLYSLSWQALKIMEAEHLDVAASFHKFIVKLLTARLKYREKELHNLH